MLELRPFQREALNALKNTSCHVLCTAPTGAGKSLIFETAARNHRVLLVSPLIALARQQEQRMRAQGLHTRRATGPDPEGPPLERAGIWIVSPERLSNPRFLGQAKTWKPELLAVDECHCLWDWGERFRPTFQNIPTALKTLGLQKSIWLSATLPLEARRELRARLPLPVVEIGEFSLPPNLTISVSRVPWTDRASHLLEFVSTRSDHGIIFVQTRSTAHRLYMLLEATGKRCAIYHAGMSSEERKLTEGMIENKLPEITIATSAFGMGMDHPHLRWVLLWQAPPSLLALAQAIGRAGRAPNDQAFAQIYWDDDDFQLLDWMTHGSSKQRHQLQQVREFLQKEGCRRALMQSHFSTCDALATCNQCDFCIRIYT